MTQVSKPFIIGVAGGTASGKSSVCHKIVHELHGDLQKRVLVIGQKDFYRNLSTDEKEAVNKGEFNVDHPDAFDYSTMLSTLQALKGGKDVSLPQYDYATYSSQDSTEIQGNQVDIIFFEGILALYWKEIRDMFDMKLFVEADPDTRLARRVTRDVNELKRKLEFVLDQYVSFVKPAFDEFCLPTKNYADVIIPRGADNHVAIDLIVENLKDILGSSTPSTWAPALKRQISGRGLRPH